MNTRDPLAGSSVSPAGIPDVQSEADSRQIPIDKVGIKSLRHPVRIAQRAGGAQPTIALLDMSVALPHHLKGTHMSRFVEALNACSGELSAESFPGLVDDVVRRLEADSGQVQMRFPYFVAKKAPVSGVKSLMDYEVAFSGTLARGQRSFTMKVVVPVTSLCPCSKEIAEYGAHNQRSHVAITARTRAALWIEDLIDCAEQQASSELYGLLKRTDEKFVTEKAYDNPKFVEDVVRDVAAALDRDLRIERYRVEVENFESIHNHSAFALIERSTPGAAGAPPDAAAGPLNTSL
jgi:GTP cyclohydrolase I